MVSAGDPAGDAERVAGYPVVRGRCLPPAARAVRIGQCRRRRRRALGRRAWALASVALNEGGGGEAGYEAAPPPALPCPSLLVRLGKAGVTAQ